MRVCVCVYVCVREKYVESWIIYTLKTDLVAQNFVLLIPFFIAYLNRF